MSVAGKARGSHRTAEPCQERCCKQQGRGGRSAPPRAFRRLAHHLQPTGRTRAGGAGSSSREISGTSPMPCIGLPLPPGSSALPNGEKHATARPSARRRRSLPTSQHTRTSGSPPDSGPWPPLPRRPHAAPARPRNGGWRWPGRCGGAALQPPGSHARPSSYPCRPPAGSAAVHDAPSRERSGRGRVRCQAASGSRAPPLPPAESCWQVSSYGARPWRGHAEAGSLRQPRWRRAAPWGRGFGARRPYRGVLRKNANF